MVSRKDGDMIDVKPYIPLPKTNDGKIWRYYAVFMPHDLFNYCKDQPGGASKYIVSLIEKDKKNGN